MTRKLIAGAVGAGLALSAAPAFAGEWKFNPRACPDLAEDPYDRIEDRFDRCENRRDERYTICPVSAFYYVPDRGGRQRGVRAGYSGRGYAYGHNRNVGPPLSYDRRMRMYCRYADGRKIFVRV